MHVAVNGAAVVSAMFWQFEMGIEPSAKSTVPPGAIAELTVAVWVTDCPATTVSAEFMRSVVAGAGDTVSDRS